MYGRLLCGGCCCRVHCWLQHEHGRTKDKQCASVIVEQAAERWQPPEDEAEVVEHAVMCAAESGSCLKTAVVGQAVAAAAEARQLPADDALFVVAGAEERHAWRVCNGTASQRRGERSEVCYCTRLEHQALKPPCDEQASNLTRMSTQVPSANVRLCGGGGVGHVRFSSPAFLSHHWQLRLRQPRGPERVDPPIPHLIDCKGKG
mmetsp:Transcript_8170/g.24637  ORF Transcript_8170/g.24637 Transcript_8170/m.24637 type:complete len:204 (-) Transcript_8170:10-621(-)|eukprot:357123-Chlamydomonas_euryale.AAC.4